MPDCEEKLPVAICDSDGNAIDSDNPLQITPPVGIQEHANGSVATAGAPIIVAASSGNITSLIVQNPSSGPNRNHFSDVLLISLDGGTSYFSVPRGGFYTANNVLLVNFKIDSNKDNTNYEAVLEHD